MKNHTRTAYSIEFKQDAVNLTMSSDRPATDVAAGLSIDPGLLRRWVKKYMRSNLPTLPPQESKDEELRRLRRELQDAREDNEILKKAAA